MKKCPFCAEAIQDEARKCKHCGEWMSAPSDGKPINSGPEATQTGIKKEGLNDESPINSNEATKSSPVESSTDSDDEDLSKYREFPKANKLVKKPGKYGWAWFLILVTV